MVVLSNGGQGIAIPLLIGSRADIGDVDWKVGACLDWIGEKSSV